MNAKYLLLRRAEDIGKEHISRVIRGCGSKNSTQLGRVNPILSVVIEAGIQPLEINGRHVSELVVDSAPEPIAGAVVVIFTQVHGVGTGINAAICCGEQSGHRFYVINAAGVEVVASTENNPEALLPPEAIARSSGKLVKPAASRDRRIAAHPEKSQIGTIGGGLCQQVYRSADGVRVLIRGQRFA